MSFNAAHDALEKDAVEQLRAYVRTHGIDPDRAHEEAEARRIAIEAGVGGLRESRDAHEPTRATGGGVGFVVRTAEPAETIARLTRERDAALSSRAFHLALADGWIRRWHATDADLATARSAYNDALRATETALRASAAAERERDAARAELEIARSLLRVAGDLQDEALRVRDDLAHEAARAADGWDEAREDRARLLCALATAAPWIEREWRGQALLDVARVVAGEEWVRLREEAKK